MDVEKHPTHLLLRDQQIPVSLSTGLSGARKLGAYAKGQRRRLLTGKSQGVPTVVGIRGDIITTVTSLTLTKRGN